MTKDWKKLTVEERVAAIKEIYVPGISSGGVALRITGVTPNAVTSFYRDHRRLMTGYELGVYNKAAMTPEKKKEAVEMFKAGASLIHISQQMAIHYLVVRKALVGLVPPRPSPVKHIDAYQVRINDYPDTLTAAAFGDPTPMRRQLMQEGRI